MSIEHADDTVCYGNKVCFFKLKGMLGEFHRFFILKQIEKP